MFICNNVDNNGVLRVRFLKLNVYSSSKACPLALMQRVARVTTQSKERWIVCWSMLRHSVTIPSSSCLKLLGCSSCGTFQILWSICKYRRAKHWFPRSVNSIRRSNFQLKLGNKHKECQEIRIAWQWVPSRKPRTTALFF